MINEECDTPTSLQVVKGKIRDLAINGPDTKTQNHYTPSIGLGATAHAPHAPVHAPHH